MKIILSISAVIFTIFFVTLPTVWADDDFRWGKMNEYRHRMNDVTAATDPVYKEECGSCHMAYPAGLLPARSWQKIMAGLGEHFGDNAELDKNNHQVISQFLSNNSADRSDYRRSQKFNRSIDDQNIPVRITETPYFRREHHEIPVRFIKSNPKISSLSQCNACHARAEQGSFNEHDIRIPGYGRWDD